MVDGGQMWKPALLASLRRPQGLSCLASHSGMVKQVALQTFWNQTTIIPAGGAGMFLFRVALLVLPRGHAHAQEAHWYPVLGKKWEWTLGLLGQAWSPTWLFLSLDCTPASWVQSHNGNNPTAVVSDPGIYAGSFLAPVVVVCDLDFEVIVLLV